MPRWEDGGDGGARRLLAAITAPESIVRVLSAMGLKFQRSNDGGAVAVASAERDDAVVAGDVDLRPRLAERQRRQRLRVPHGGGRGSGARSRLPWAALLQWVFGVSVLVCPQCAGPRRVLAAIHDPAAIARVLRAVGLSGAEPGPAACRAPPVREGGGQDGESGWPE